MSSKRKGLSELESAEDFMNFFALDFDTSVLQIKRLHIMQKFHNYLKAEGLYLDGLSSDQDFESCRLLLKQAYDDFVDSSAQQQKVLKVFQQQAPAFVALDDIEGS
ncbi:nitrogenase-stabilizing/protective protein NifW [Agaribacterium sp. ZY112]|uniref:nitrogenase-stabilizing/protective protein NifW n=1 Tax=Agaribacterium sp. ZY112 TaxID=3233574 RepID=UPI003523E96D